MNPPQVSTSLVPPGGYIFDQALVDGSYSHIVGASLDDIGAKIWKFRLANPMVLPPGCQATLDASVLDYHAQTCAKYPWNCTPQRTQPQATMEVATGATGFQMLYNRMERWIGAVRSSPIDWVDNKTAADRALICASCHANTAWETNCGQCNQSLAQQAQAVLGNRSTAFDGSLRACRAFGTLQKLAVWMALPGGDSKYIAPPQCWRLAARE